MGNKNISICFIIVNHREHLALHRGEKMGVGYLKSQERFFELFRQARTLPEFDVQNIWILEIFVLSLQILHEC